MTRTEVLNGVKMVLTTAAGIGITALCSTFAGQVASTSGAKAFKKVGLAIAGAVIGGMVAQQAEKYINSSVDNVVQQYDDLTSVFKKANETPETDE